MDDLMTEYDVIVVGTGMTESILAAALSRIGKSVLHLDSNDYYGENWASFNFESIQIWKEKGAENQEYKGTTPCGLLKKQSRKLQVKEETKVDVKREVNLDERGSQADESQENTIKLTGESKGSEQKVVKLNEDSRDNLEIVFDITPVPHVWNIEEKWHSKSKVYISTGLVSPSSFGSEESKNTEDKESVVPGETKCVANGKVPETYEDNMKRESRKFNLDLTPKVLFSRGQLVELLISSNIAKYAEFKSVSRVLTWRKERLELVPCSRADVFSTKNITVVEKRLLVKILSSFLKYPENSDEFNGFENKTFMDYLKYKKLPNNIMHYVLYAMAMGDKKMGCLDGVKASKSFLESLGVYGNTPFIFSLYGSGELPQCFCRLCAVFGGVYCLKRGIEQVIVKDEKCLGVMSSGKRLNARTFVFSSHYVPSGLFIKEEFRKISRGIFITDRSILKSGKEPLTLLLFPPVPRASDNSVTVIELGPGSHTCPENFYLVHMTSLMTNNAGSDLKHVADALFHNENTEEEAAELEKPNILWSITWNAVQRYGISVFPENLKVCSGPSADLDFNFAVEEAKRLFKDMCPNEEFLPRAPDPDEIVLEINENEDELLAVEEVNAGGEGSKMSLSDREEAVAEAEDVTEEST